MTIPQARNLAQGCVIREWRKDEYEKRTSDWLNLCVPFTGRIEPLDGHVAALDLSGHPQPLDIALRLVGKLERHPFGKLIYGAGPSKWVAKLSSRQGDLTQAVRNPAEFLSGQPVNCLLSIEPEYRERLAFLGYREIGDVTQIPIEVLRGQFGEACWFIAKAAQGMDGDSVQASYPPHLITEVYPFAESVKDQSILDAVWEILVQRLVKRLEGQQAGAVAISIEWEDGRFDRSIRRFTRPIFDRATLRAAVRAQSQISRDGSELGDDISYERAEGVRGLSITLSRLEPLRPRQQPLIAWQNRPAPGAAVKSLQEAFGEDAVILASRLELPRRELVLKEWRRATGWV